MKTSTSSTAQLIRKRIEKQGEGYWRHDDFPDLPAAAVSKTLSRLSSEGYLQRIGRGLYYRPRKTRFGYSRPLQNDVRKLPKKKNLCPAGINAANLLGFTTQNAVVGEFATSANSFPRSLIGERARIHTRRPATWNKLSPVEASLLDFLRSRGKLSELSPIETRQRLLEYLREADCFERLANVAKMEPPRVRAMLGAIGQELNKNPEILEKLRKGLNPLSRFDFGVLRDLQYAKEWQAR